MAKHLHAGKRPAPYPHGTVPPVDLGPQYKKDDAFTARMRFHQSWYRATVLDAPCGTGPLAHHTSMFGNMLTKQDGDRGLNFLSPEIAALAKARQEAFPRGIERHRLLCNMLSSQPMCFNLFAPIALDEPIGCALVSAMLDGVPVSKIRRVVFEHSPTPHNDYLGDSTAFDAFVEFESAGGTVSFVGVETKLTEKFHRSLTPSICDRCIEGGSSTRKPHGSPSDTRAWATPSTTSFGETMRSPLRFAPTTAIGSRMALSRSCGILSTRSASKLSMPTPAA